MNAPIDFESVWVVCPAFNESRIIGSVLKSLRATGFCVAVVDDASEDDTGRIAAEYANAVLTHPVNLGQGAALKTGIDYALSRGAKFLITFDADGQHRVSDITALLSALVENSADFALGSRFLRVPQTIPFLRMLLLRTATAFTCITTGLDLTDTHNGLRAFTRRGVKSLNLRQNRMAHASEILSEIARSGLPYTEVPVAIDYTDYSKTKGQSAAGSVLILIDLFAGKLQR